MEQKRTGDFLDSRSWPAAPAIYQIYPRSFLDTTGSGIGDLAGVTAKLDHVAGLGVDAIWLSPYYVSPWADGGYDIVDHRAVEPRLGTMADFDDLVSRAHDLGLLVMIDQVLNHTSCEHPWFLAALDGDDAMAERYLFRDPRSDGTVPNNWLSFFGQAGWSWSHKRRQYFFHQFLACQPSLNLRHPAVQKQHREQIRFWRDKGVSGFRFDAVTSYLWDDSLNDNPPATPEVKAQVSGPDFSPYTWQDHVYDMLPGDGAHYAENLREWAGKDAYLIGEIGSGNKAVELAMAFSENGRLDAAYTIQLPENKAAPATISEMAKQGDLQKLVGWLGSHDQPRHNSSGLPGEAAFFAMVMAFLPGPWLIYQGEEWGLSQPHLEKTEVTDPYDLMYWPDAPGREGARVPLPWNPDAVNMGFSTSDPWLPMRWDADAVRAAQRPGGTESTYRELLKLRRSLGWNIASIRSVDHGSRYLDLVIAADNDRLFRGWFHYGGDRTNPPLLWSDAIFAVSDEASKFHAAIWAVEHIPAKATDP